MLVKYNSAVSPFNDINRIFDNFFGAPEKPSFTQIGFRSALVPIDILEGETGYVVRINAAGVNPQDVKISVEEDGVLDVSILFNGDQGKYLLRELPQGEVTRRFKLPKDVQVQEVEARALNGIIEFDLPYKARTGKVSIKIS